MPRLLLTELLDAGLAYAPEYGKGLANHLPMALCALDSLGASGARLSSFFSAYVQRLEPALPPRQAAANWAHRLGRSEAFGELDQAFRDAIGRDGVAEVLRVVLPVLMPGIGAAAFHGLIRTAYGVHARHAGETAAGLAYWACRYLPLAAPRIAESRALDVPSWLGALATALAGRHSGQRLISDRMEEVGRDAGYALLVGRLEVHPGTLGELAAMAANRYCASRNFTVLHLVTSCHALRLLLPSLDDPLGAVRAYAPAYAAGFIASGIDLNAALDTTRPLPWEQVIERALGADDEHVVKLVYSCREEALATAGSDHPLAATWAVGGA